MPDACVAAFAVRVAQHRQLAIRILEDLRVCVVLALAEARCSRKRGTAIFFSQRFGERRPFRDEPQLALEFVNAGALDLAVFVRQLVDNVVHLLDHPIVVQALVVGRDAYLSIGCNHGHVQRRAPDDQRSHTGTT